MRPGARVVSVIIPVANASETIGSLVRSVRAQATGSTVVEVLVVDDGSTDDTALRASAAGARVLHLPEAVRGGNPAAARNLGAKHAKGDPLIFLDADCTPLPRWLDAILTAHDAGATVVGGAMELPPGLPPSARCDYYCGWYVTHARRGASPVPHHPPPNLSVRRDAFLRTSGFTEKQPFSYTNEERHWQAELRSRGHIIWFEPRAAVYHWNRPGFANLLRRNYRWAYTAVQAKHETVSTRMAWLYRRPWLVVASSPLLAMAQAFYILTCWLRAGRFEPLLMFPVILVSRVPYAAGMFMGGLQRLRSRSKPGVAVASPRWQ